MCSRATRSCLKEPLRNVAIKRSEEGIKFYKWNSGVRDLKVGMFLKYLFKVNNLICR